VTPGLVADKSGLKAGDLIAVRKCHVMLWCPFYPRGRSLCVQVVLSVIV
jgi:hypothetical protein